MGFTVLLVSGSLIVLGMEILASLYALTVICLIHLGIFNGLAEEHSPLFLMAGAYALGFAKKS